MNNALIPLVRRAVDADQPLLAGVTTAQHSRPTPCPGFDLKALAAHVIGGLRGFAAVGEGKPFRFDVDPDLSREDPAAEFRAAADRVVAAFSPPDMADRTFAMPWGDTTGAQLLGFELIELVVHGWDVARALGAEPAYHDDLVEAALAGARMWVDDSVRTPQMFGPEVTVAADAPVLDRLVGFLGRSPDWTAQPGG